MLQLFIYLGMLIALFIVDLLVSSVFLWIATKVLKFGVRDYWTALKTSLAALVVSAALTAFSMIPSLIGIGIVSTLLLILAAVVSIPASIYFIKRFYNVGWPNAFLAFLITVVPLVIFSVLLAIGGMMLGGVVLWQLGVSSPGGHFDDATTVSMDVSATGWSRTRPLNPSVVYSPDGTFQARFVNTAGIAIKIKSVTLQETLQDETCANANIDPTTLKAGESTQITATCPLKEINDPYDLYITIEYETSMAGINTTHKETGHIKGAVDDRPTEIIAIQEKTPSTQPPTEPTKESTKHVAAPVTTGWAKTRPLSPSITYSSDGGFQAMFVNTVGIAIKIKSVTLQETLQDVTCVNANIDPATVKAGAASTITATCPLKEINDPYDLYITLEYETNMGGITTTHQETGHIKGEVAV